MSKRKKRFLDFLFNDQGKELHDRLVQYISQHPKDFLSGLKIYRRYGRVLYNETEPEAFEKEGKRVDVIFVIKGGDFREDHWTPVYRIILVEVKTGEEKRQKKRGAAQLKTAFDFFLKNWEDWLIERVDELEGGEVWLDLLLLRARKGLSWRDMLFDLSHQNLPGTTKLGKCPYIVKVTLSECLGRRELSQLSKMKDEYGS